MAFPNEADLKKKRDFKDSLSSKLSFNGQDVGKMSDKQICSILRSNVRKTWMMSPIRLLKLEMARIPDMNPDTRTKWLCECEKCNGMFKMTEVETDHIKGEHKLVTLSDIEQFARSILDVSLDDLQVFCKECHAIKTHAERHDMSFEEAKIEKKVILWVKENNTEKQKKYLTAKGFKENEISNAANRRISYKLSL